MRASPKPVSANCVKCGNTYFRLACAQKYCIDCTTRVCKHCGQSYRIRQQTAGDQYCSSFCFSKSLKDQKRIGYVRTKRLTSIRICEVCQKECKKYKSNARFCSQKCFGIAYSKENHHNWRGGVTRESDSPGYKSWHLSILVRDMGRCRWCDSLGQRNYNNIEVHHIIPFAVNPDLATNINNGIALCKTHHNLTRGRENQFAEFLSSLLGCELISLPSPNRKDKQPFNMSRDELEKLYWFDGLSSNEIGKMFNVTGACVLKYMEEYGIARRDARQAKIIRKEPYNRSYLLD